MPLHVAIFIDQHSETLGGMQTSVRLQKKFLERLGHRVTLVSPALRHRHDADPYIIELPSIPAGPGEYAMFVPNGFTRAVLDRELAKRPPLDLIHIQGDFWAAIAGYQLADRRRLPVVHTMHNNVHVGIEATMPVPKVVVRGLGEWQKRSLGLRGPAASTAWEFLGNFAQRANAVTAPSSHFAQLLEDEQVFQPVRVVSNGLDDDIATELLSGASSQASTTFPISSNGVGSREAEKRARPRLSWTGRFSQEKRLLPFLEAVKLSGIDADIHIFGGGALQKQAEAIAGSITTATVHFRGSVPYPTMLRELQLADALVQTSIGFESQGMTVFEAAALGTPSILADHRIAADLPEGSMWLTTSDDVAGLAHALETATADISNGSGPSTAAYDPTSFFQSAKTELMLELYREALGQRASTS
ncbi:glycosyltransferase [Neomicrococcus lactis]|uniref:Glycosyltransferase involved in cell wall biosynthesis n=1 Tax=Neomicrococcus lactis TaxID=732241 RepID=A0A7W8YBC1_9MICC|nr:glycosyltransferase [Neomicrococcus lactis]MBB5598105.1 glycosyltransferase involved in cell wall biosynthesis [Neomicrococcus lactis]